jgi:hypothetical protein
MRRWKNDIKMDLEEIWSVWATLVLLRMLKRVAGLCEENHERSSSVCSKEYPK